MDTAYQDNRVQPFIGFVQYVRKFIRNFSEMAAPFTDLIISAKMFKWTTREHATLDKLKMLYAQTGAPITRFHETI